MHYGTFETLPEMISFGVWLLFMLAVALLFVWDDQGDKTDA